jgi:hypothetical protein
MNQANEQSMQQLTEILLQHYGWAGLAHDNCAANNSCEPVEMHETNPKRSSRPRPGRLYTAEHEGKNTTSEIRRTC